MSGSAVSIQDVVFRNTNNVETTALSGFANSTYKPPFGEDIVIASAALIIFFLVFGIIANTLTITVILTSPKLRNVFNHFILSLCCSDLISACISWICLYRRTWGFDDFALPNFFCVFYWGADIWTSYVTAQHIAGFAVLRLLSIWKPITFSKIKLLHAKIMIAVIWIVAFVCGFIPMALFSGARHRDRGAAPPVSRWPACTQNEEWLKPYTDYTQIGYSIFFYIPCVVVFTATIAIIVVMTRRRSPTNGGDATHQAKHKKRRSKEKQAILQLLLIVGSFMLGYIPFTAFEFYTIGSTDVSPAGWRKDWLFGTVQYLLLRFSECLNPIFYNLASTKMRLHTKMFLIKLSINIRCRDRNSNAEIRTTRQQSSQSVTGLEV